jgi:RND family efflux transporter MFP subunit
MRPARPSTFFATALALLPWLASCRHDAAPAASLRPPLVEAVQARRGALPLEEIVPGVVRAENQVAVRPQISAQVAEVLVRSGEAVEQGQLLVRLRDDELREQLRRAEADVRLAEASAAEAQARTAELETRVARLHSLAADELVSPQELETAVAQQEVARAGAQAAAAGVEQARATVEERRSALAKTRVRAPVAGRVGERRVEVGMLVAPDTVLFRVGNLRRMTVEVELTEEMLSRVEVGQPVILKPRGPEVEPLGATLDRVSPFLAEETFTTVGEIDLDNPDDRLRPGMFVTVRILYGASTEATLIPTSALWEDPQTAERGVFVVNDDEGLQATVEIPVENPAEPRDVSFRRARVLAEGRGTVGVDGIADGQWVVIAGQHLLRRAMQDDAPPGAAADVTPARIRPVTWERVNALQALQKEDLLLDFLDKQRRISRALGAEIPADEGVVRRALEAEAAGSGPGAR